MPDYVFTQEILHRDTVLNPGEPVPQVLQRDAKVRNWLIANNLVEEVVDGA